MVLLTDKTKSIAFLVGIVILFVGLTLSKAVTSLVTVYFLLLFLLQGEFNISIDLFRKNKPIKFFLLFLFWIIISLLWSENKIDGFKLVVSNLNFFTWPILMVLFSEKINRFKNLILILFTLIITSVSIFQYVYFQYKIGFNDIREMSVFVSHIRFALMVVISFFIGIYFFIKEQRFLFKTFWFLLLSWLLFYTYNSQVLSGLLTLIGGFVGLIIFLFLNKTNRWIKGFGLIFVVIFTVILVLIVIDFNSTRAKLYSGKLDTHTKLGNEYKNNINSKIIENGYYLDIYYCKKEVDSVWKLRSNKSLDDLSPRGYSYNLVLIRYLTSKGLRKDAFGVNSLSSEDIKNIENGIPSVIEFQNGFFARYNQLKFEFSENLDPNGHSILQRFEFWKASSLVIKNNWLFGVGLGSSKNKLLQTYKNMNTRLLIENQLESHNQFLSIWITFGIIGLSFFVLWLISIVKNILNINWLYLSIFFVLLFSLLVEDTLSTLTGMTLFAFFAGFFQNNLLIEQE